MMRRLMYLIAALAVSCQPAFAQVSYPGNRATDSAAIKNSTSSLTAVAAAKRWLVWSSPLANSWNQFLAAQNKTVTTTVNIRDTVTMYCTGSPWVCSTTAPVNPVPAPTPVPIPTPSPIPLPTGTGMPNRPTALPALLDWDCSGSYPLPGIAGEIGFQTTPPTNPLVMADATGPKSPGSICRHNIAAGGSPGQQVGGGFVALFTNNITEVYVARWLKPSLNLIGAGDGSKGMMINSIYHNYSTNTAGAFVEPINLQGRDIDSRNDSWLGRNRASTPMVRGQWNLWEIYVKLNEPGIPNGVWRQWVNGVLQSEYTDWMFRKAGQTWAITQVSSNFYQNQSQTFAMWWDMDHFFVSGR